MAEKYVIDFKDFDDDALLAKYTEKQFLDMANSNKAILPQRNHHAIDTMTQYYDKHGRITESQKYYIKDIVIGITPEYKQYKDDFFAWYDSRDDIQEVYQYAMSNSHVYVRHPDTNAYVHKSSADWVKEWNTRPGSPEMFQQMMHSWNVRKFREIKRETVFEEGDLIVLRKGQVGNWRYDPYYEGFNTPDKLTDRIGTVMQMTEDISNRSRGGKGSRLINVLWVGGSEIKGVPERVIKLHERKRRTKK